MCLRWVSKRKTNRHLTKNRGGAAFHLDLDCVLMVFVFGFMVVIVFVVGMREERKGLPLNNFLGGLLGTKSL